MRATASASAPLPSTSALSGGTRRRQITRAAARSASATSAVTYRAIALSTVSVSSGNARMKNSVPATERVIQWKIAGASSTVRCQIFGWSAS